MLVRFHFPKRPTWKAKSGQLSPGETAKLENQQQGITREVSGMRQVNGGKLTNADKKAVNQQHNKASENLYNKKQRPQTVISAYSAIEREASAIWRGLFFVRTFLITEDESGRFQPLPALSLG